MLADLKILLNDLEKNKTRKLDKESCVLLKEEFYICLQNEKTEECRKLENALYNCFKLKIL
tara:strand:- start:845 stop:1027 length:183 start_codon:yes stop_codon:yes gene_type:complete